MQDSQLWWFKSLPLVLWTILLSWLCSCCCNKGEADMAAALSFWCPLPKCGGAYTGKLGSDPCSPAASNCNYTTMTLLVLELNVYAHLGATWNTDEGEKPLPLRVKVAEENVILMILQPRACLPFQSHPNPLCSVSPSPPWTPLCLPRT